MNLEERHFVPPKLSVVIPVYNEASVIRHTIENAFIAFPDNLLEVLVVDACSNDNTSEVVHSFNDARLRYFFSPKAGRAQQLQYGAERANGEVILFLHADTQVNRSAGETINDFHLSGQAWGFFGVCFKSTLFRYAMLAFFINWRSRLTGISTGDQTQFVKKDVFQRAGGFPDQILMEDVELSRRLKVISSPYVSKVKNLTSERKWLSEGFWKTVFLMWRLRFRYFLGADPNVLHSDYYKR